MNTFADSEPHKVSEPSQLDLYRENQMLREELWQLLIAFRQVAHELLYNSVTGAQDIIYPIINKAYRDGRFK